MKLAPLVLTTREPVARPDDPLPTLGDPAVENVHHGSIAVVSADGRLIDAVGDPAWSTFTRSTLKPFQALPFVREGGPARFGWSSRQVALLCASHSGEAMHVDLVKTMLSAADCDETCLQCGCQVPGYHAGLGIPPPPDARGSALEHNCSGKHAGFLAACRLHREPVETYLDPSSPLQRRIRQAVASLAGLDPDTLPCGTDGCSAPNYALPLSRLAGLYAQLAQGAAARSEGDSLDLLFDAMTTHPDLVSGTARSDLALMTLGGGDWVAKIGADGVQAIGIRSAGIGIAIKVADGNRDALYCVVVEVLRQLGLLRTPAGKAWDPSAERWFSSGVHNARGLRTGRLVPAFKLAAAVSGVAPSDRVQGEETFK